MAVRNLDRLKKRLAAIPKAVRVDVGAAIDTGAAEIVGLQKRLAPKKTGALANSIVATKGGPAPAYSTFRSATEGSDLSVTISAGNSDVRYAHLVEFGTKPHKAGGKFEGADHPGTRAKPFFFPDEPGSIRKHVFSRRQIVRDSTSTNFKLALSDGAADIVCEYYADCDPRRRREVRKTFGEVTTTPRRVALTGISSHAHAVQHATWMAAAAYYRRETRSITTEYEGRLVQRGDPALIDAWYMTEGRAAGVVDLAGTTVHLDTPVEVDAGSYAVFRNRRNRAWGPVRVASGGGTTIGLDAGDVAAVAAFHGESLTAVLFDDDADPTSVIVGPIAETAETYIVQSVEPQGRDRVTITALQDSPLLWSALGEAPAPEPPVPGVGDAGLPAVPVVPWIRAYAAQRAVTLAMEWSVGATRGAAAIIVDMAYGEDFAAAERVSEGTATSGSFPLAYFEENDLISVRAWAVSPAGLLGPWVVTSFTAFKPEISDIYADIQIRIADLTKQMQRDIEEVSRIGEGTIRDALKRLEEKVEEIANAAATEAGNSFDARQLNKVAVQGAQAGLLREIALRIEQDTAIATQVDTAYVQIANAQSAIQNEATIRASADSAEALARTTLNSRVVTAEGTIAGQATAVNQLQTIVTNINGQISATSSSVLALQTTVGGHTSTLTTYGASINGVSAKWGVAWAYNGQAQGGIVLTGIIKNDGTGYTQFGVMGDVIVSGTIYGDKLAANNIITGSAQIGELTVDYLSVKYGAITNSAAAAAAGTTVYAGLTTRPGAKITIIATFVGASGTYVPAATFVGHLVLLRDGVQIDAIPHNFEASGNNNNAAISFQSTVLQWLDFPPAGGHTYNAYTTNGAGIGGIRLLVQEAAK